MSVHSISIQGKRPQNEDKYNVITNIDGRDTTKNEINLYCIYDGHGGDYVSKFLHKHIPPIFMDKEISYPLTKQDAEYAFNFIQNILKTKHTDKATECGSTCIVVEHYKTIQSMFLNIYNVGDCRCVLCTSDNFAIPLTKDHKPDWPEEYYRIMQVNASAIVDLRTKNDVVRVKDLSVSRAFGDLDAELEVPPTPEIFHYKINKNDKFIVLACDGLWDVMSNHEVVNFILLNCYNMKTQKRNINKENIAEKLAQYALAKNTIDNVTIIIVFF